MENATETVTDGEAKAGKVEKKKRLTMDTFRPDGTLPAHQLARVRSVDWIAVRKAYTESVECPSFAELGAKHGVSEARVRTVALREGWGLLRSQRIDEALRNGDATTALLRAAKADNVLTHKFASVASELLDQLMAQIAADKAAQKAATTRMNTLNTASFALGNIARAMKEVGIVGLPKALKQETDLGNGRWNPQLLANLNVTVQTMLRDEKAATPLAQGALPMPATGLEMPAQRDLATVAAGGDGDDPETDPDVI